MDAQWLKQNDLPQRLVGEISRYARKSAITKIVLFDSRTKETSTKK